MFKKKKVKLKNEEINLHYFNENIEQLMFDFLYKNAMYPPGVEYSICRPKSVIKKLFKIYVLIRQKLRVFDQSKFKIITNDYIASILSNDIHFELKNQNDLKNDIIFLFGKYRMFDIYINPQLKENICIMLADTKNVNYLAYNPIIQNNNFRHRFLCAYLHNIYKLNFVIKNEN